MQSFSVDNKNSNNINTMIQNIVILLLANTLIPLLPVPPQIAVTIPFAHYLVRQPSVYEHMNLSRIHSPQQFKKSFRDSLKVLHPDRGGDQVAFSKVKNLKKIMQQEVNYYDTLNITDVDLQFNIPFKDVVSVKTTTYYVQAGVYYFIVLLYVLAYTIQDDMKPARKILLPAIILFASYEFYIHFHPQVTTFIDLLHNKLPIFVQKALLKTMLSTFITIVRTKFVKRVTEEKKLIKELNQEGQTDQFYKDKLQKLQQIYKQKVKRKKQSENSWGAKIRSLISKGFTILVLFSIAKGLFSSGKQQGQDL